MNKLRNAVIISFVIFSSIYSEQRSSDSLILTKFPGLDNFLLPCWKATYIQYPDSSWIPESMDGKCMAPPLFNIYFEDTCHLVPRYEGLPDEVQPNLMLCFYPISQKSTLIQIVDESVIFSWCIPIIYDETNEYFIITSPCFRNNGYMGDEVKSYFEPQDSALHVYFSISENASKLFGYRNTFHEDIDGSNTSLSKQFHINGRVKIGGRAPQPTIRLSEKNSRWILQLPLK